jgi:asparagine synthetase B (glutamine-hydrolysing)
LLRYANPDRSRTLDLYLSLHVLIHTVYQESINRLLRTLFGRMTDQTTANGIMNYPSTLHEAELAEELRVRLKDAVRMRLISEVPLGAHLSGGIDSSVIVALMAELSDAPVKTFSVGFEEESFSELEYARAVAQKYSTDHHEFTLTYGDIPATLEKIIYHFGEPFADPSALPLYHIPTFTNT